jgi:hypothetical protein
VQPVLAPKKETSSMEHDQNHVDHHYNPETKGPGTIATTMKTQTTISTFVQRRQDDSDALSETDQSQTTFTSSVGDEFKTHLSVPPPPNWENALNGIPFQCPLCFSLVKITGQGPWM